MAFRGQFEHSLDAKNRLTVPTKLRAQFSSGLVLAKGLEPCITVWSPDEFENWTSSFLSNLNPVSAERRKLTRFFAGNSWDVELDSAGRVTLNAPLLAHARIDKEVVLVGNLDHLEVWDRATWQSDQDQLADEIVGIAEGLGHPS